jgi:hypothetical protein
MREWIKLRWNDFLRSLPWWLTIGGLFLVGLEFVIDHRFVTLNFSEAINATLNFFASLGQPILIGGVFGSLLKTYQYLGIFKDAVKEVIFEKPWFDDKHLIDLWKKISNAIYKEKFPELASFLHKTILEKYFPTDKDFYYSEFEISFNFSWKDGNKKMLVREDTLEVKIKPFNKDTEIEYKYSFEHPEGSIEQKTSLTIEKFTINEKDYKDNYKLEPADGKFIARYNICLKGAEEYTVCRKSTTEFSLDNEPYARYMSTNFIKWARVNVTTREDDLKIKFLPLGTLEEFQPVGHSNDTYPSNFSKEYKHLMFPNQGFILVFSRNV